MAQVGGQNLEIADHLTHELADDRSRQKTLSPLSKAWVAGEMEIFSALKYELSLL